jgi:hypothetical protein
MSGVAEAERWVGAFLTVFFGVFCCTIIARNAIKDYGFGQCSLSTLN